MIHKLAITVFSLTMFACSNSSSIATTNANQIKPFYDSEEDNLILVKSIEYIHDLKNPEKYQQECLENKVSQSCALYSSYLNNVLKQPKESYQYSKMAYDYGKKITGYSVGGYQLNHPEWFTEEDRLTIDEIIECLEQSLEAGSDGPIPMLMSIYRNEKYGRIDYKKSEYYNKMAIEKGIRKSRLMLATLYLHDMKDYTKIDESIALLKEDLNLERNLLSAYGLMVINLYPKDFGREQNQQDMHLGMAYAYITRDLRKEDLDNPTPNGEDSLIEDMKTVLTPEDNKKIQTLYQQIKAEMDAAQTDKNTKP